jgi:hypothetical protein
MDHNHNPLSPKLTVEDGQTFVGKRPPTENIDQHDIPGAREEQPPKSNIEKPTDSGASRRDNRCVYTASADPLLDNGTLAGQP